MPEAQNLANHKRYVMGYHGVTFALMVFALGWTIKGLIGAPTLGSLVAVITVVALVLSAFYGRFFALQAQNRIIRLEEQLRMAALLPSELKNRITELRMPHFVALRFASDAELPDLVRRVLAGELSTQDSIKQAIKNWRGDYDRV